MAIEIYSDRILYSGGWTEGKTAAAVYGYEQDPDGIHPENVMDVARIYAEKIAATILENFQKQRTGKRALRARFFDFVANTAEAHLGFFVHSSDKQPPLHSPWNENA